MFSFKDSEDKPQFGVWASEVVFGHLRTPNKELNHGVLRALKRFEVHGRPGLK